MSIRNKIILLFCVIAAVIGLLAGAMYLGTMRQAEHIALHEAEAVAKTVSLLTQEYVETGPRPDAKKRAELQEHVGRLKEIHDRDIVIVDRNKTIIADAVPEEVGTTFAHDRDGEVAKTLRDGLQRTFLEMSPAYPRGIRQIVLPLRRGTGDIEGAVILEYTPLYNEIRVEVRRSAAVFLWLLVGALALVLVLGLVFSRTVSLPLSRLREAAHAVASGDLRVAVRHRSRDEFGTLATSFNHMVEGLRASRGELASAEAKFRALFEHATDGVFIVDQEGRVLDANRTAYERLGYTKEELLARRLPDLVAPEYRGVTEDRMALIRERGAALFESAHLRKDGTVMPVEVNARMLEFDGRPVFLSSIRDITERRKADDEMRTMNRQLQTLIQSIPDMVLFKDTNGRHLIVNRAAEQVVGRPAAEILGATDRDLLPPAAAEECRAGDEEVFRTLKPVHSEEWLPQADGTSRYLDLVKAPLVDSEGKAVGLIVIGRDVTERKISEEILRESEEQYRELVENVNSIVLRWTGAGRVVYMNRFGLQFFGFRREELAGRHVVGTIVPETDRAGLDLAAMIEDIGRNPDRYRNNLNENMCSDGRRVMISWTNRPVMTPGGQVKEILSIGNDVTERLRAEDAHRELLEKIVRDRTAALEEANAQLRREMDERERMEAELIKAQKLESLGVLAGGIAHDFNNLLTSVLGNVSLALGDLDQGHTAYRELARAERATLRAQELTQQLLTFSKGGAPVRKTASVADLVRETAGFALRGTRVKCEFDLPEDLRLADIDAGQISQVIHNLIVNADHAMPDGGVIAVRGRNAVLPLPDGGPPLPAGEYVRISVRDSGIGIRPEHLPKIFDPYFTTKQRGSGLGLATCYSIIRKHGGGITVESAPGEGTVFDVYLPASSASAVDTPEETAAPGKAAGRVLIMDDEEDVRETAGSVLRRLGYAVALAEDGGRAVAMYREARDAGAPYDAVIMDLTVPGGMGGREAVALLRELDPGVRAIVSSGYSNDPVIADYAAYGFAGTIAKPYRMKDLGLAVQKVLTGEGKKNG